MIIKEYVFTRKRKNPNKVSTMKVKPHLVIVQVNDDEASSTYVRGKLKDCEEVGVRADLIRLASVTASQDELLSVIDRLNRDPDVHGFIVQMPLPKQINEDVY
jgi:methylenetetrahydrofolate dehydrogenase (NADP+)/methenyltetrahydrofolate cyclohydrolase